MNRLNNLYDQITPKTSAEELSQRVMNTELKATVKKRPSKAVAAILAAAVSVSALTVTAGAANGWDYAGMFRSLFGEKAENLTENIVPEATVIQDTIDTMNFELVAAAADKHSILAFVDVYSENGYKLIEKDEYGNDIIRPFGDLFICINPDVPGSSGVGCHIIEKSEEKVRLGVRMSTENMIKGEKATVQAWLKNKKDENGEYMFENGRDYSWSAEFMVDYSAEEIRYEKEFGLCGSEITAVEVSSISVCLEGRNLDDFFATYWAYGEIYAVLDSGEKIYLSDITSSSYIEGDDAGSTLLIMGLESPVNPEDVSAVCIGGETIEIK